MHWLQVRREAWRILKSRIGYRGSFLLFLAVLDEVYAWALHLAQTPQAAHVTQPNFVLPLPLWIAFWTITGFVCLVSAFLKSDRVAFALAAALKWGWGVTSAYLWMTGQQPNGWLSTVVWFAFGSTVLVISVWPEPVAGTIVMPTIRRGAE